MEILTETTPQAPEQERETSTPGPDFYYPTAEELAVQQAEADAAAPQPQEVSDPSHETSEVRKPGFLRRFAQRAFGRGPQTVVEQPVAPYGYTDDGVVKEVKTIHVIDHEGKKPTVKIPIKNW